MAEPDQVAAAASDAANVVHTAHSNAGEEAEPTANEDSTAKTVAGVEVTNQSSSDLVDDGSSEATNQIDGKTAEESTGKRAHDDIAEDGAEHEAKRVNAGANQDPQEVPLENASPVPGAVQDSSVSAQDAETDPAMTIDSAAATDSATVADTDTVTATKTETETDKDTAADAGTVTGTGTDTAHDSATGQDGAPNGTVEEACKVVQVPSSLAGYIIGTRGETIRRLEASSGARIRLAQEGLSRDVTITGTQEAVDMAAKLIDEVVKTERERAKSRHPTDGEEAGLQDRIEFLCPRSRVGLIIGRGGEKIKMLEEKSGARIQVVQDGISPYAEGKPVVLIGSRAAVEEAQRQINGVIGEGHVQPSNYSLTVTNCPDGSVDMEVAAGVVGLVIGRQGETIKNIQADTETVIEMDRDSGEPLRKMKLKGTRENLEKAYRKIMTIIEEARRRDEMAGRGTSGSGGVYETHAFPIASNVVGLVIGRGGETIHQIQDRSGAKVQLEQNTPPGAMEKRFLISGTMEQVEAAKYMIWDRVGEGQMPMSYRLNGGPGPYGQPSDMYPQQGYGGPPGAAPYGPVHGMAQPQQSGPWRMQPYANSYWPQNGGPGQQPEGDGQMQNADYNQYAAYWQSYYGNQASQQAAPANQGAGQAADYSEQWAKYWQSLQQAPQSAANPAGGENSQSVADQWAQYYASQSQTAPR